MKRGLISLLLMLVVGLCACRYEPDADALEMVCGTWFSAEYQQEQVNPGYFELRRDGTGSFQGAERFTWTAEETDNDEFPLVLTLLTQDGQSILFHPPSDIAETDDGLLLSPSGVGSVYWKMVTKTGVSWFDQILTRWYTDEEENSRVIELKEDGTGVLNGAECCWTVNHHWSGEESNVHLLLFDDGGVCGAVDAYPRANGLYDMSFYDYAEEQSLSCYRHPLTGMLSMGTWQSFERYTAITDYFSIGPWYSTTSIAGTECDIAFAPDCTGEKLTADLLEGDTVRYTVCFYMEGDYPMATLTDRQSGQQTLYYSSYYGYDPSHPDAVYYQALAMAYQYANGYSVFHPETDQKLEENQTLAYIYTSLSDLGDYKQASDYLARFKVVPDKLTKVIRSGTDGQGEVTRSEVNSYGYDIYGTLRWIKGEDAVETYGVYDSVNPQRLYYDKQGRVAQIRIGEDTVHTVGEPIYDTVDKLVGMVVQERDDEYVSVFTYNAREQVIRLEIEGAEDGDPLFYYYTYDDEGKLITKEKSWHGGYSYVTSSYTYEGEMLAQMQQRISRAGSAYTDVYTFTTDDQGRPLSAVITTNDPETDLVTQELAYVYEDLYFFDCAGLELEEADQDQ